VAGHLMKSHSDVKMRLQRTTY